MSEQQTKEDIVAILRWFAENDQHDSLWWCVDRIGNVEFSVNIGDVFEWGCAEYESVTVADLPELQRAKDDIIQSGETSSISSWRAVTLWASRKQKTRIQYSIYKDMSDFVKPLFKSVSSKPGYGWPIVFSTSNQETKDEMGIESNK